MALLAWRHPKDWHNRARAVVTDTATGLVFQVNEEEDALMSLATEAIGEIPFHRAMALRPSIEAAMRVGTDEIFAAMAARRNGDETAWLELSDMRLTDWKQWWSEREAEAWRAQRAG